MAENLNMTGSCSSVTCLMKTDKKDTVSEVIYELFIDQ